MSFQFSKPFMFRHVVPPIPLPAWPQMHDRLHQDDTADRNLMTLLFNTAMSPDRVRLLARLEASVVLDRCRVQTPVLFILTVLTVMTTRVTGTRLKINTFTPAATWRMDMTGICSVATQP